MKGLFIKDFSYIKESKLLFLFLVLFGFGSSYFYKKPTFVLGYFILKMNAPMNACGVHRRIHLQNECADERLWCCDQLSNAYKKRRLSQTKIYLRNFIRITLSIICNLYFKYRLLSYSTIISFSK